jgi:nucleosome assembly protein 1-like 1
LIVKLLKINSFQNQGFSLTFEFGANPFFTNTTLTKRYVLAEEDDMLEKIEGCKIDWQKDKNLTVQVVKKKKKGELS